MMTLIRLLIPGIVFLSLGLGMGTASAQAVRGQLRDGESGRPIGGAILVLLDEDGAQAGGTLTDESGTFFVRAPAAGRYRLRAERIGYRSATSPLLDLAAGQTLEYPMEVTGEAVQLEGVIARSERRCTVRPEEGLRTAMVWEEARKALTATVLADSAGALHYRAAMYERKREPGTLRITSERRRSRTAYGARPFVSLPPERLLGDGFVRQEGRGFVYYAPDAQLLVSDAFLDTHCFRLTAGEDPDLIGLQFEPVRGRRVPEIAGTFWLHRKTAALRFLEYNYTNLGFSIPLDQIGGRVEFEQAPNNTWMVRKWWIRMPEVGLRTSSLGGRQFHEHELVAIREEGGEVTELLGPNAGRLAKAERARLSGTVRDSTRSVPLESARVCLAGTEYCARTDAAGRFRVEGLPEGTYAVEFSHPRLDSLGVAFLPPRDVELRPGTEATLDLAIPSLASLLAAACPASAENAAERTRVPGDEVGMLVGVVRDEVSGEPLPGVSVMAEWSRFAVESRQDIRRVSVAERSAGVETTTDAEGRYRLCEVPALIPVTVRARVPGREGPQTEVRLQAAAPLQQDLRISLSQPVRLFGRVLDAETSEPIASATVRLSGIGGGRLTDAEGRFALEAPPGPYALEIEHLAYGAHSDSVQVDAGRTNALEIRVPRSAVEVEGVVVTARSRRAEIARMRATPMRMLAGEEMARARTGARHVGDLVSRLPGLTVREGGNAESAICIESMRRLRSQRSAQGCDMVLVYLDGVALADPHAFLANLPVDDIESVEYLSPSEAGVRYGTGAARGVLLVHTRGNGPFGGTPRD